MKQNKLSQDADFPQFKTLEEEKAYWNERSPLAHGRRPKIQPGTPKHLLNSYLSVRMSGKEIDQLREIALKQGLGASTFAREVLVSLIKQGSVARGSLTMDNLKALLTNLPAELQGKLTEMVKDIAIGDKDHPYMLILDASQAKKYEEVVMAMFAFLLSTVGVKIVTHAESSRTSHASKKLPRKELVKT